ncbi:TRAP transporter substrate-binding protein [Primorskyibacter sp. 2E233]|uniref:TRAP transporter substrate-binding protein n=1 Tax=Primorskyibacter sp. 2E233 TaxID=3413431 RepID=UPI003BF0931F
MNKWIASVSLSLVMGAAAQAEPVTLKFAHFWPTTAAAHTDFATDWTNQVTECSNGDIQFEFHTGGSQLGKITKLEEFTRAGLVDIAHGLNHVPRGRFPHATVMDTPLLGRSAYANSKMLWTLYEEGLISAPYEGLQVLAIHSHNASILHTNDSKQIRVPEDMEGLRFRSASESTGLALEALGAVPVGLPATETYEALAKGTAAGTFFPWEAVFAFKIAEVLDYHTEVPLIASSFFFAMNENKYNSLSEEHRACIDQASYAPLVDRFGTYWDEWDRPGRDLAIKGGNEIVTISESEMALWEEALEPVIGTYLASLKEQGVENIDDIYARAKDLVTEYQAEYENRAQ